MKPPFVFYVFAKTYNCYGSHRTLSLISDFLVADAPSFGKAVTELTVTFHFPTRGPAKSTLEQLYKSFHANWQKLPKIVFRRSRGQFSIDVASNLMDGDDWRSGPALSATLFRDGFREMLAALARMKARLTANDDFRVDEFLNHCLAREANLPCTNEDLAEIEIETKNRLAAIRSAMTPWERLGIDWRNFHSDAPRVLNDPFYWEEANDFSPHGNDTGADLLSDYRRWLKRNPAGDPLDFFEKLVGRWGYSAGAQDQTSRAVLDDAAIALAFAELKLRGTCRSSVIELAIDAIHRQRQEALQAVDWDHRDERLKSLDLLEAKLPRGV